MKTISIFVRDSYHTAEIVDFLQTFYGELVHCSAELVDGQKYDLFFLSGRDVLENHSLARVYKEKVGSDNAKVVAMSVLEECLTAIDHTPDLKVDFTFHKSGVVEGLVLAAVQQEGTLEAKFEGDPRVSKYNRSVNLAA